MVASANIRVGRSTILAIERLICAVPLTPQKRGAHFVAGNLAGKVAAAWRPSRIGAKILPATTPEAKGRGGAGRGGCAREKDGAMPGSNLNKACSVPRR